jgi:hypothetical protein
MCEAYWDKRLQRWVSLDELEHEASQGEGVALPTVLSLEPKRKPAVLVR